MNIESALKSVGESLEGAQRYERTRRLISAVFNKLPGVKLNPERYLNKSIDLHSKFKNIYVRDRLLDIRSQYVPSQFVQYEEDVSFILNPNKVASLSRHVLIKGHAGAGKSCVLKHLFFRYQQEATRIPILIYLKDINPVEVDMLDPKKNLIVELVRQDLDDGGGTLTYDQVCQLLPYKLAVILDAFDEVPVKIRRKVSDEIHRFQRAFRETHLIISSRPDSLMRGGAFAVIRPQPISPQLLESILEKLARVKGETEAKSLSEFSHYLKEEASDMVKQFCHVPLTGIMSFMVFKERGRIEDSLTAFFNQLMFTLWHEHDSTKPNFERENPTNFEFHDINVLLEFVGSRIFLQQRVRGASGTSVGDLEQYIKEAQRRFGLPLDSTNTIVHILTSSISMLQVEANEVEFAHRSLEEYFSGKYVLRFERSPTDLKKWMNILAARQSDSVFHQVVNELMPRRYWEYILSNELDSALQEYEVRIQNLPGILNDAVLGARMAGHELGAPVGPFSKWMKIEGAIDSQQVMLRLPKSRFANIRSFLIPALVYFCRREPDLRQHDFGRFEREGDQLFIRLAEFKCLLAHYESTHGITVRQMPSFAGRACDQSAVDRFERFCLFFSRDDYVVAKAVATKLRTRLTERSAPDDTDLIP